MEVSDQAQRAFQIGHEVGEIAQQLCPNGILIKDDDNLSVAISATISAMNMHPDRPLFEATFEHDGLLVRTDVLLPTKMGYRMTEVKASTSVKPYHVDDCAVQAWVLKQNHIKLNLVELAYGNCQPSCRLNACVYAAILSSISPSIFLLSSVMC